MERRQLQTGIGIALMGYVAAFAVVLAGLRGAGASPAEAASGLVAVSLLSGLGTLWLSRRNRIPVTLAWSTPGAAVLVGIGHVPGGWPAAVGAFLVTGALIVLTGVWPRLGALIAAIPAPIAQAMLAGVVLELCLVPVRGLSVHAAEILPIVATWLIVSRLAPRWAVLAAFAATLAVAGILAADHGVHGPLLPHPALTAPVLSWPAVVGIAFPLYIATMAGQNVPGAAIMRSFGFTVPWRAAMTVTGLGTLLGGPFGGHAINLAAITASVPASPEAHPDPRRRWHASMAFGWTFVVLAVLSTALTTYLSAAPESVIATIAGLGLLGVLGSALRAATEGPELRLAATLTFAVAASGVTIAGVAAPAWAILAGLLVQAVAPPGVRGA